VQKDTDLKLWWIISKTTKNST